MGIFYFHLFFEGELVADDDGSEFVDLSAARCDAVAASRELLAEAIKRGKETIPEAMIIADALGRPVETVVLKNLLPASLR